MKVQFSVLMSVYAKEKPEYLSDALDSIIEQTVAPDEIILVEDGPLSPDLLDVIHRYKERGKIISVKLPENVGLGVALNKGLVACSNDLVARMDSDDISIPYRFECLIEFMQSHPQIDICSSWVDEFIDSPDEIVSTRKVPSEHIEIQKFIKTRNPINHPAVIFRKSAVDKSGGYRHFPLFEDWYLWARMMVNGCQFANIPKSLLLFRTSKETFKRRGGWKYAKNSARFQWALHRLGLISCFGAFKWSIIRGIIYIMPNHIREFIYRKKLRS